MHQVAHEPAEALANDSAHPLRALNSTPVPPPRYTSRMQKGGALLQEMRLLVQIWTDASLEANRAEATPAPAVDCLRPVGCQRRPPSVGMRTAAVRAMYTSMPRR